MPSAGRKPLALARSSKIGIPAPFFGSKKDLKIAQKERFLGQKASILLAQKP
jgi:hypothetical protein